MNKLFLILCSFLLIESTLLGGENEKTMLNRSAGYPGGQAALNAAITSNIRYPERAKVIGVTGVVYVNFTIMPDGSISQIYVAEHLYSDLDQEALRVVSALTRWEPAMRNGEAVPMNMRIPVQFSLH